ncbi:MAG: autotransporter-associated beta strand repeat-containing protein [Thermoguttaceae bacterium]|jgi:autotransporter-associated beta strand protein|nr:autotransporter-associated beta strand repeat-containing protein [Thermoguttaceae bacterium]
METRTIIAAIVAVTLLVACTTVAHASVVQWSGGSGTSWGTPANWVDGTVPQSDDEVLFGLESIQNLDTENDIGSLSLAKITVTAPAGPVSIGGNALTVRTGGIDMSSAMENLTIAPAVTASGSPVLNVAAGRTLMLSTSPVLSGTNELIKDGPGALTISDTSYGIRVRGTAEFLHKAGTLNVTGAYPLFIHDNGTMTQEDGTINANGIVRIGDGSAGTTATYNMASGTLALTNSLWVGWRRKGVFNHSGGTVTAPNMRLASDAGSHDSSGTEYNLSGAGQLTITGAAHVGYRCDAEFLQTGGAASFGQLHIGGGGSSPGGDTAGYTITAGQLAISSSLSVGASHGFTGNLNVEGGNVTVAGSILIGGASADAGGTVTQTGGNVTIASAGALSFGATGAHTAAYHLDGGTLTLGSISYTDSSTQQFNFGGGTLQANANLSTDMPMSIHAGGATIDTQSHDVILAGVLSGGGGLTKLGVGALTLTGPNSYGGGTTISAGTLQGDTTSLQGNMVNHATLVFDQTTAGTFSGAISGSGVLRKTGAASLTLLGGTIGTLGLLQGELIKDSPGSLTIADTSAGLRIAGDRVYTHKAGTLNVTGTYPVHVQQDGTITQEAGEINSDGRFRLGDGDGTATYNMEGGELNVSSSAGDLWVGWKGRGVFNHSGGTVRAATMRLASDAASSTTPSSGGTEYNLSDTGALMVNGAAHVGYRCNAEFLQTGGTTSFGQLHIGGGGAAPDGETAGYTLRGGQMNVTGSLSVGLSHGFTGTLNVEGGELAANGDIHIGGASANATGVVTQSGGQVTIAPNRALSFRATGDHTATYNLNGGTLALGNIQYTNTSTQQFSFGGGTLQANADLNSDMPMSFSLGGATIDTQVHYVAVDGQLSGDGGLEKLGDGTLTLTGANAYAGGTTVVGGTLMVENVSGSGTGSGPVSVNPAGPGIDAILGGTGTIAGTVTVHSGGMHAPGASVGEQAIGGAIWNPGGMFQFEINDAAGIVGGGFDGLGWDLVTIDDGAGTGKLDLTSLSAADPFEIHVVSLDGATPGAIANFNPTVAYDWVFVTYDELVDDYFHPNLFAINIDGFQNAMGTGHFAVTQMAGGLAVSFIPEPGTFALALTALVLLVCRRRR